MRRRLVVRGPRGAALVWADYAEPARWPRWSPQVRRVDVPAPLLRAGLEGTVHRPARLRVPFVVTALDAASTTWAWDVRVAGVALRLEHGVRAVGDGCLTWLVLEGPAAAVLAYSLVARLALRRLVGTG